MSTARDQNGFCPRCCKQSTSSDVYCFCDGSDAFVIPTDTVVSLRATVDALRDENARLKAEKSAARQEGNRDAIPGLLAYKEENDWLKERLAALERDGERTLNIARGCLDYGGGYRGDPILMGAFHHGIHTVINTLEAAAQINALERIGRAQQADAATGKTEGGKL